MNKNEPDLRTMVLNLAERVEFLEKKRPGRKPKPIVVSQAGVCGVDPDRDSETCPDASIYRNQHGCKGIACKRITDAYYDEYRAKNK